MHYQLKPKRERKRKKKKKLERKVEESNRKRKRENEIYIELNAGTIPGFASHIRKNILTFFSYILNFWRQIIVHICIYFFLL